jgi:nickel-dependent lactate racemase
MVPALRYGIDSTLDFNVAEEALVAWCDAPRGEALADVGPSVDQALASPLEFPPLARSVVPGDKVAIALERDVPQAAELVGRTARALVAAGILPEDITLVRAFGEADSAQADPLAALPDDVRAAIADEVHDPSHRGALSYLGAGADGKPIYINRAIYDADFVILIGCFRPPDSPGSYGIASGIFPMFSDAAQRERFFSPRASEPATRRKLRKLVDEVGWLLGVRFTLQVVPGGGGEILHVLAGDGDAVLKRGGQLFDEAWSCSPPRRAELVVATIQGDAAEQTWDNVARALAGASAATSEEGAVVLCTDLAEAPPSALDPIVGEDDLSQALSQIAKMRSPEALAGIELVNALQRGKVYLISELDDETVEDLGISPIRPDQLSRLASRHGSCLVLANAHRAIARPSDVEVDPAPRPRRRSPR